MDKFLKAIEGFLMVGMILEDCPYEWVRQLRMVLILPEAVFWAHKSLCQSLW